MANLKEQEKWEDGIYQIEENDPVLGGENGITNKPIKQLANRTTWLKKALELLTGQSKPKDLTADSKSVADGGGHSHALPKSSTSQQGIVQLDSATNSTSENKAATPKAIKTLKDLIDAITRNLGNYIPNSKKSNATNSASSETVATSAAVKSANDNANSRVSKSGDTMTGDLSIKNGEYSKLKLYNASGKEFRFESTPDDHASLGKVSYRSEDGATEYFAQFFPKKSGTFALTNEVIFNSGNQSIRGILKAENVGGAWAAYQWGAKQGIWQLEVHPDSHTAGNRRFNMLWMPNSGESVYLNFPNIGDRGETVAYHSFVTSEVQKVRSLANQNSQNFNNYIHNSKKSNAVDSNSTDTVASSRAVKLAFDRGTTALNTANSANTNATNANNNANTRASKRGLGGSDLNNVTESGIYGQNANVNATTARHYPIDQAGMLIVTENSGYGAQQLYAPFNAGYLYARGRNGNGGWDNWKRIDGLDKLPISGGTMTGELRMEKKVVRFTKDGNIIGYVGAPNPEVDSIRLSSNLDGYGYVELQHGKVFVSQSLYVGSDRVALLRDFTNPAFTVTNNANNNASLNNINGTKFLSFGDGALNGLGLPSGADWVGIQIADQAGQKTQIISGGYSNHYIRTNDDLSKNVWHSEKLLTDKDFTYQKTGNFEIRRYPDGTMIQTYFVEQRDIIPESQDKDIKYFNWANAFVSTPIVFSQIQYVNNAKLTGVVNVINQSSTGAKCAYRFAELWNDNQGDIKTIFLAIGRWK